MFTSCKPEYREYVKEMLANFEQYSGNAVCVATKKSTLQKCTAKAKFRHMGHTYCGIHIKYYLMSYIDFQYEMYKRKHA